MVQPAAENLVSLMEKHRKLCLAISLDDTTAKRAWQSFEHMHGIFTLEGEAVHWLCCSVYVACRTSSNLTAEKNVILGSNVSLITLVRHGKMNFPQFFNKIKYWLEMTNANDDLKIRISNMQQNFHISHLSFREFVGTFTKIFNLTMDSDTSHRNRKQKHAKSSKSVLIKPPCSSSKIFDFFWNLFIVIKGSTSDIVVAYNYLLVCCDLAFKNALLDNRRDILQPDFKGLPSEYHDSEEAVLTAPCIVDLLCMEGVVTECRYIKEYTFKTAMRSLFTSGILKGDDQSFTGLLQPDVFEVNLSSLNSLYESKSLVNNDFDDRIFTYEYRRQPYIKEHSGENIFTNPSIDGLSNEQCPDTPLTGRRYLGPRDISTPGATNPDVTRWLTVISACSAQPSDSLLTIFRSYTSDPQSRSKNIVTSLSAKYKSLYPNYDSDSTLAAKLDQRVDMATKLFYKSLRGLLQNELTLHKDITKLVENDLFLKCVFACCIQIIAIAYQAGNNFSSILEVMDISSFHFVRVIELIIRAKDQLPRHIVKQMNIIEELILSSIIWKSDSLLWPAIKKNANIIPKYEDIALRNQIVYTTVQDSNRGANQADDLLKSPGPSAVETFQSPVTLTGKTITINGKSIPISANPISALPFEVRNRPKKIGSLNIIFRKFFNLAAVRMDHLCTHCKVTDVEIRSKIWTVLEYSIRKKTELMRDRHLDQLLMCAVYVVHRVANSSLKFLDIMGSYRKQPQMSSDIYRQVLISRATAKEPEKRDSLVEFYNKVYVTDMNTFAVRFMGTPTNSADGVEGPTTAEGSQAALKNSLLLSPLPSVKNLLMSPRHQVAQNIFIRAFDSPNSNRNSTLHSYIFNRSASKELSNINEAINSVTMRKRAIVTFDEGVQKKPKLSSTRVQRFISERHVQQQHN